jgi:hypothetical protein
MGMRYSWLAELEEHTHWYEISSVHFDDYVSFQQWHYMKIWMMCTLESQIWQEATYRKKVLKNVGYVTETYIIAFGTNDKHYEGKSKTNLLAVIQLVNKYDFYAWTTAQTNRTHHFTPPNQQNAQYSSLDTYIIISHWIFLHVLIHKGRSSGNPTKVIAH